MKCAVVLIVKDFKRLSEAYGLDYGLQSLANANPSEPAYVLIAEGFENIPRAFLKKWDREHVRIEDCSKTFNSLLSDFPYLTTLPGTVMHRVTFLRLLVLERYFSGEPVLSFDADFVWRVDPYRFFGDWKGGYFALGGSSCLVHVNSPEWFRIYREGLKALTAGGLTSKVASTFTGSNEVINDQQLIQHLAAKRLIRSEWEQFRASPQMQRYWMVANPLKPKNGFLTPPERLVYTQTNGSEFFQ